MKILSTIIITMISFFTVPIEETEIDTNIESTQINLYSTQALACTSAPAITLVGELVLNPTVCEIVPGSCACLLEENGDWDEFEKCLDDRYGPESK
jgi:hypothetical protein